MRAFFNHSEDHVCGAAIHPGAECYRLLAAVHAVVGIAKAHISQAHSTQAPKRNAKGEATIISFRAQTPIHTRKTTGVIRHYNFSVSSLFAQMPDHPPLLAYGDSKLQIIAKGTEQPRCPHNRLPAPPYTPRVRILHDLGRPPANPLLRPSKPLLEPAC